MSLCQSIDTLAMAFLDDELVAEERRELELHLLDCGGCRQHVDAERSELSGIRRALVAPPAPARLKLAVAAALDGEDRAATRSTRQRVVAGVGRWMLPGAGMMAAAAAILAFVFVRPPEPVDRGVVREAVRQQARPLALDVQGAATGPWVRQHFAPIEPPQFVEPSAAIELLGGRMIAIANRDAVLLRYGVGVGRNQIGLNAVIVDRVAPGELEGGTRITVGDRTLFLDDASGRPVLIYIDSSRPNNARLAYIFTSEQLRAQELLELVVSSDLIGRAQQGR